ncbi:uncharacterized protein LOC110979640 [Acanthaster planci]|uniref:Uncharacterized protein LOC110979640 n=1 Tax=Acanthaster planci TaxID=133434 RepID=A0A8B7YDJ6_ACAPL|nr:uncharacterized protein LOC110979640 [Acanthaster planci]
MALTERDFRDLARSLGPEWEGLATELDIDSSEVYRIKQEHYGVSNQIFQMLVAWQRKQSGQDLLARERLQSALTTVKRHDLAERLQAQAVSARGDAVDSTSGGVHINANFMDPAGPSCQPQAQAQPSRQQQQQEQQQRHPAVQTYTYEAPPGTVPYVGRLTITGRNSPVIIGSVSHSTFNFGGGGGRSGDRRN